MDKPDIDIANSTPSIVSVEMGYGHLRAAYPLVDMLDTPIIRADEPPLSTLDEQHLWRWVRNVHEGLSKLSQLPGRLGELMRASLDSVTMIDPLHAGRDLTRPNLGVLAMEMLIRRGLGHGLVEMLQQSGASLLTTYYAIAVIADHARLKRVYCIATDADVHRIWAPKNAANTTIFYFAPSYRVVHRLRAYGVPKDRIAMTGFPLPLELLGDRELSIARKSIAARLVRLDPNRVFIQIHKYEIDRLLGPLPEELQGQPPLLTFAIGGAGAQANMAAQFLLSMRDMIKHRRFRLALVAGIRRDVRMQFEQEIERSGLSSSYGKGLQILFETTFEAYYRKFNALLADTDILWTKPSELSFYAALGLPLVLANPLGDHERFNRRWLLERGAALKQRNPRYAGGWLQEWLNDGALAGAAWSGFNRLPKVGTYLIADKMKEIG